MALSRRPFLASTGSALASSAPLGSLNAAPAEAPSPEAVAAGTLEAADTGRVVAL